LQLVKKAKETILFGNRIVIETGEITKAKTDSPKITVMKTIASKGETGIRTHLRASRPMNGLTEISSPVFRQTIGLINRDDRPKTNSKFIFKICLLSLQKTRFKEF